LPALTILVVEDDPDLLRFAQATLRLQGYRTLTAVDGTDAVALLAKRRIHGVVLDLQLPGIDGYGVLRWLRNEPRLAALPVVIVSALPPPPPDGRTWYVPKPASAESLLETVANALASQPSD